MALATVDGDTEVATGATSTTTTTAIGGTLPDGSPAPGEPGAGPAAPAPGGTGSAPGPAGATPPPSSTADLNSLPERPTPPRPGAYTYGTKFDGQFSASTFTTQVKEEEDTTKRFESVPGTGGEARDREKAEESSESRGGFNFSGSGDRERAWRQNGMFIASESGGGSGPSGESYNATCDWQPDAQALAFPLRQGAAWTWDSTCESKSENFDTRQTWRGEARVTGVQTASVGGREVRVLVIERRSERQIDFTVRDDGQERKGKTTVQETTRQLFAPSVSLTVREDSDVKGTFESDQPGGSGRFEGKAEMELRSLDPK